MTPCEVVTGAMWLKARDTLNRIADLGAERGVTFMIENLNRPVDHPGVPPRACRTRWRSSRRSTGQNCV